MLIFRFHHSRVDYGRGQDRTLIGRQGEIRDRSSEGQHYRMAGLNLLAAIVIYWNTAHLGEAVRQRKHAGLTVEPELLAHISPLGWAHILLTGEYPVAKTPLATLAYDSAPYRCQGRRKNAHTHTIGQINIVIGNLAGQGLAPNLNQPFFSLSLHARAHIHSDRENVGGQPPSEALRSSNPDGAYFRRARRRLTRRHIQNRADSPLPRVFGGKPGLVSVSGRNRLSVAPAQEPARACGVCVRAVALL